MSEMVPAIYQADAMVGELKLWKAPDQILAEAKQAADALQRVIEGSDLKPVSFGDKKHLRHEHWEILGHFYGYCTKIVSTEPVQFEDKDGIARGFLAVAELLNERTGAVVGRVESMCLDNEEMWGEVSDYEWQDVTIEGQKQFEIVNGKQRVKRERIQTGTKPKPLFQLRSMAQTRASAKAFRHKLGWVVVLAGYSGTPAEEMTGRELPRNREPEKDSLPSEIKRKPLTPNYERKPVAVAKESREFASAGPAQSTHGAPPTHSNGANSPTRTYKLITDGQARRFYAIWKQAGKTKAMVTEYLLETIGVDHDSKIPADRYKEVCAWAEAETKW